MCPLTTKRACIFAAFRPIVDTRIRRDRTWSIYFAFPIDAAIAKESTSSQFSHFILSNNFFRFGLFDAEKNKKRYSTDDTVAPDARPIRTRTSLRSLDKLDSLTRCVFCRSLSSSLFSSPVACSRWFVLLLFISLSKEELFYSDDSRAKSARDDAARSASFFEY